ncbi:MAG: LysR family transcriptional regulator [Agathobaculum sp.]|jgi:LysR family transcriptional activator of glutamate synthase operon|uniref:LysR family transcriptional regulator n=1 Tax=Agathobaculum sp. TaxID=2048138 RepID=UPI003D900DDE
MQLLHLYYFKMLAETEHLLNTAKAIHISPPALSTTISKLEAELGVELFDHVGRKIRLNENGKILYIHVCNIFSELDDIQRELSKSAAPQQDIVKVAVSATPIWNPALSAFTKAHPDVMISHSPLRMEQLQNMEFLEQYDLIITDTGDIDNKAWEHEFIIEDPPVLLVNQDHPFVGRDRIALFEARDEDFVSLTKGYSSRSWFENSCKQAGFIPRVVAEVDYMLRTKLIENGYGIGFSSVLGARAITSSAVKMVRVKYPPNPRMQAVFWKAGVSLSKSTQLFREFLIDFYSTPQYIGMK